MKTKQKIKELTANSAWHKCLIQTNLSKVHPALASISSHVPSRLLSQSQGLKATFSKTCLIRSHFPDVLSFAMLWEKCLSSEKGLRFRIWNLEYQAWNLDMRTCEGGQETLKCGLRGPPCGLTCPLFAGQALRLPFPGPSPKFCGPLLFESSSRKITTKVKGKLLLRTKQGIHFHWEAPLKLRL